LTRIHCCFFGFYYDKKIEAKKTISRSGHKKGQKIVEAKKKNKTV
jgi:hypothetical protein